MLHLGNPLSINRTPPANTELENCHSYMVLRQPTGQLQVIGLSRTHPQHQVQMSAPSILLLASADLIPLPTVILKGSQPPPPPPLNTNSNYIPWEAPIPCHHWGVQLPPWSNRQSPCNRKGSQLPHLVTITSHYAAVGATTGESATPMKQLLVTVWL